VSVRTYGALPSVTARLTKRQIADVADRDEVGMIYLIEDRGHGELNSAAGTRAEWWRGPFPARYSMRAARERCR